MTDSIISPQVALVYLMVLVSASDSNMTDQELRRIGQIIESLPAFASYDGDRLVSDAEACAEILDADGGLDAVIGLVKEAIPDSHTATAYAIACDVAVVDEALSQEELRILEMIRHELDVDRLTAAAIERGAAARFKSF